MSSSEISSIYKSRSTILDLMKKQKYTTIEYLGFSINEISIMYQTNQLDMLLKKENPEDNRKIYIKYFLNKSLRKNNIDEMVEDLFTLEEILTKEDTLLIIIKDEINETIQTTLKQIWEQEGIFIIIITIQKLQFNILEHSLVPNHRIMEKEEIEKVKTKYNIMDNSQWPEISRFDPVGMAIGARPGDICEITRPNKSSIVEYYYRLCTNN
jgi:DNA-directed RNA polymerase subunit H